MKIEKEKDKVAAMFDTIAPKYDFLNHILSLGIDKIWRRKVVNSVNKESVATILDIASGTGDLAIALARRVRGAKVIGVDISEGMLKVGREKVAARNLTDRIEMKFGDALALEFDDESFDVVTSAFGVRNFEALDKGLAEMFRVVRPGGKMVILEFSMPTNIIFRALYKFYFLKLLPLVGNFTSKSSFAYTYLPESVTGFASGDKFLAYLEAVGGVSLSKKELTGGIASIYVAYKK